MYSIKPTPIEVSLQLAKRFREVRRQMKYSQEEMADCAGVSLGSLKRFERTGKISLESLLKLMHLLDRLHEFDPILQIRENPADIEKLFSK
jgi:transcriptional regulator with XRE-family HTH domain